MNTPRMLKKLAFGGIGLVLLATPLFTSALTLEERIAALQTQLQTIMAQIDAILAGTSGTTDSDSSSDTGNTESDSSSSDSSSCVSLSRYLYPEVTDANSNDEVTKLQHFLVDNGHLIMPSGASFGYYGGLTTTAVQDFQRTQGIVSSGDPESTGYGAVGRQTRARIAALTGCTGGGDSEGSSGTSANVASTSATVSGNTVTAHYENLPADSYIELTDFATDDVLDDTFATGISGDGNRATSTVPSGTYFLRVKKDIIGSINPTIAQSSTFRVGASTSPLATVSVEVSGSTVTATYVNLPQHSYFQLVNLANNNVAQGFNYIPADPGISDGDGTRAINSVPAGTYYLRVKQYVNGDDINVAQSSTFKIAAAVAYCPSDALVCPDGTTVGRTGPNCSFAACPSTTQTCNQNFRNTEFQKCATGVFAARFGQNCDWELCPYGGGSGNAALGPVITVNGIGGTANPPDVNIASGATTTVSWSVTPAGTTCTTSDGATTDRNVPLSFTGDIGPYTSAKTFSMTCTNSYGQASKTLRINVGTATTGGGGGGGGADTDATAPTITSFASAASVVASGRSTNLSWAVTPVATSTCWIKVNDGNEVSVRSTNSNYNTGALTADSKYTLSCHASVSPNASSTRDVSIKVVSATFTANGAHSVSAQIDEPINYVWDSKNANQFAASYTSDRCGSASWTPFLNGLRTPGYTLAYSGNSAKGTRTDTVHGNQAGCTYTITYTATDSVSGVSASDKVTEVMGTTMPASGY